MALEVVSQLLQLSRDPENRPFIVNNDGCLPGLVMFLENEDADVVRSAVETIHNLSLYEPNREILTKTPGLIAGLNKLKPEEVPLLSSTLSALEPRFQPESSLYTEKVAQKINAAKTHIFYIKGMNNLTKHKVEETLVGVKGVVSFLIDVHTHKAVVRTMTSPDAVVAAIKQAGLTATYGETEGDGSKDDEPDYLPEGQRGPGGQKKGWGWGSVISMGSAKKAEPQPQPGQGHWGWNSVVKAIWG